MHGPSCIYWASLTPFSLQTFGAEYEVSPWVGVATALCARDRTITCHGRLTDHPAVTSLVTKRFESANYSVGFSAALGLPVWLWMEMAEQAGVHLQVRKPPQFIIYTKLVQKLGQLQPFIAAFPLKCMGQLPYFWPT